MIGGETQTPGLCHKRGLATNKKVRRESAVFGMGADGGTIPNRADLVQTKGKEVKKDDRDVRVLRWRYCALSKEPLKSPVVICKLGRLYNKEAILKHLIDNSHYGDGAAVCEHIKRLKDVTKLNLATNVDFKENDPGSAPFLCPVTRREMNGFFQFVFLKGCGCVLSQQALNEIRSDTCLKCGKERQNDDVVELNKIVEDKLGQKRPPPKQDAASEEGLQSLEVDLPSLAEELDSSFSYSRPSIFRKTLAISSLYKK